MKEFILKKLSLKNWRSLNLCVEFNSGRTMINGMNELGKSSLFHAWCWLLSGYTDSVNVKNFNLFDENAPLTPDTPIASVKATIGIDGIEYTLERRAKATFKRNKGDNTYTKASSDTYTMLIDSIETSMANWNDFISNQICDHEMITYLLSGDFLANLAIEDKHKARKVMLSIVGEIKDSDYKGDYSCLAPQFAKSYTLNQIEEQAKNQKSDFDKQIIRLDADIKSNQKKLAEYSAIDYVAIQSDIESKKKTIADIDNIMLGKAESIKPILGQRDAIFEIINSKTLKLNECRNAYLNKQNAVRNEIKRKISDIVANNTSVIARNKEKELRYNRQTQELEELKKEYKSLCDYREVLRRRKDDIKAQVFSGDTCPYCQQDLPMDMMEKAKAKFNKQKQEDLDYIVAQGKQKAKQIEDTEKAICEIKEIIEKGVDFEIVQSTDELEQQLASHDVNFKPYESTDEYHRLTKEIEDLKASLPEIPQNDNEGLTNTKDVLMAEIDDLNQQMGLKSQCDKLKVDIADLQDKHKTLCVETALCERTIMKVKEYREEQANIVSQRINDNLDMVSVDMFRTKKDGTNVPDCIIRGKHGVQYATINNSAKTLINIELQQMMMKHFGVQLPIWIDECKNFDSKHTPNIDGQHIMLYASDSPVIVVE